LRLDQWVDESGRGRGGRGDLVMVENDDVDTASAKFGDCLDCSRAAIHCDEERGGNLVKTIPDAVLSEAVALVESMWEVWASVPAELCEDLDEQCGRGDAVNVVVAEDGDVLVALACLEEPVHSSTHVWNKKRVGEVFEARFEEAVDAVGIGETAIEEALGEQWGNSECLRELACEQWLLGGQ